MEGGDYNFFGWGEGMPSSWGRVPCIRPHVGQPDKQLADKLHAHPTCSKNMSPLSTSPKNPSHTIKLIVTMYLEWVWVAWVKV